jgi:hypothetical protein
MNAWEIIVNYNTTGTVLDEIQDCWIVGETVLQLVGGRRGCVWCTFLATRQTFYFGNNFF